jgi:hypothetical protein
MRESFGSDSSQNESERHQTPAPVPAAKSSYTMILIIVMTIGLLVAGSFLMKSSGSQSQKKMLKTRSRVDCSKFIEMKKKFSNQDEKLFKSLKTGIEGIYRDPQSPSVYTFFSTDENSMNTIINDMVEVARNCIKLSNDPINLTIENIRSEDFIATYKDELNKRKIMIVRNVDSFPTSKISLLHSFTDTHNPIVAESIIWFTVKVPHAPKGKPVEYIHDYLKDKWEKMPENKREPLITRMIDQTFYINMIKDEL